MLEYHIKMLDKHPGHAICFRGDDALDKRTWIDNGVKKFVFRPTHLLFPTMRDCYLAVPGHWHSVSYRRKYFGDDFNEELFSLADGDDIIIGYYLKKHDLFALCTVWDKETDFRPIVDPAGGGTPCYTFPIIYPLGFPVEAGGYLIRKKNGGNHGKISPIIVNFMIDHSKTYIEKDEK
jgi:hypothetical protein